MADFVGLEIRKIVSQFFGEVAERLKAAVSKTVMPKGILGSNPNLSAKNFVPKFLARSRPPKLLCNFGEADPSTFFYF